MLETAIKDFFSKNEFVDKKFPIFSNNCEDDGCKLVGPFYGCIILNGDNIKNCLRMHEKSVDRIIVINEVFDKSVDVVLCELTSGQKRYTDVVEKIKQSGTCILKILKKLGFEIRKFKCIFVGKYKNAKRVTERPFSIPDSDKHNITIKKLRCGSNFSQIF